jgi:hypothetical protein
MEYADYARHCLKIVARIPDQESRIIHREMAAEWFKLADQAAAEAGMPDAAEDHAKKTGRHG